MFPLALCFLIFGLGACFGVRLVMPLTSLGFWSAVDVLYPRLTVPRSGLLEIITSGCLPSHLSLGVLVVESCITLVSILGPKVLSTPPAGAEATGAARTTPEEDS